MDLRTVERAQGFDSSPREKATNCVSETHERLNMVKKIKESGNGFPREFAPGIWWLSGCFPIVAGEDRGFDLGGQKELHSHTAAFLVVGTERTLMVDTGTPGNWLQLSSELDQILDGRTLNYLMPTHWEVPHAGNVERLVKKYPGLQLYGDLRDFHLAYPQIDDKIHIVKPGVTLDLGGGYVFHFLEAPIKDLINTSWGYESKQKVLFPADGFSYTHHVSSDKEAALDEESEVHVHLPGECSKVSHELGVAPTVEQAYFLTQAALWWTRFTPINSYFDEMEALLAKYPPRFMAPAHGNVISNVEEVMSTFREAYEVAYAKAG